MARIRIDSGVTPAEGVELHYERAGRGPNAVLVASMLVRARSYRPLLKTLARSFRVTVVEMPGSGRSSKVERPLSVEEHAQVLKAFLDRERIARAVIIGHSNSGPVALQLSLLAPEMVERLVLVGSTGVVPQDNLARVLVARGWDTVIEPLLSARAWHHLAWNAVRHPRAFVDQIRQSSALDLREKAHEVAVPTLLAWGRRDHTVPRKYGSLFRWHFDRSQFVLGPGSHDWLITEPEAFTSRLLQALADPSLELPRYDKGPAGLVRAVLADANQGETALLRRTVGALSVAIGERHLHDEASATRLQNAATFIRACFESMGFRVDRQPFLVNERQTENLAIEIPGVGRPNEIVVLGAHYDSAKGSPGANDDATGVALLLALARRFATGALARPVRTVRLVAIGAKSEGSWHYAQRARLRRENVVAMLNLEALGASAGDIVDVTGDAASRTLVDRVVRAFRTNDGLHARASARPTLLRRVTDSDHRSFWQHGFPAVLVTDSEFRRLRRPEMDTVDRVDFERLRRVLDAVSAVIGALAWKSPASHFAARPALSEGMNRSPLI